ncbi:MAG: argininosuccinate synthase domain-containing protein, partial [Lactobacillaceae bacterium]
MTEKIVLAYSGGLDTSVAIPWLKDKGYEVIAVVLNVGQPNADFDAIQQKALNVGALDSIVVDAQDEFADHYVAPVIKANA